jgi:hypothetical protein
MWNSHPVLELIPVGPQDIAYLVSTNVHLFSLPYLSAEVPQDPTKIEAAPHFFTSWNDNNILARATAADFRSILTKWRSVHGLEGISITAAYRFL